MDVIVRQEPFIVGVPVGKAIPSRTASSGPGVSERLGLGSLVRRKCARCLQLKNEVESGSTNRAVVGGGTAERRREFPEVLSPILKDVDVE